MKTDSMNSVGSLQLFIRDEAVRKGLIQAGHYGIPESEEKVIDLGVSVDLMPLARRPKAIDTTDMEALVISYDMESKEFKGIAAKSGLYCEYGPAFLVFERSTGHFLEFFCGNKSSRIEAKKIFPFLPLTQADIDAKAMAGNDVSYLKPHGPIPVTLTVMVPENRRGTWYVPVVARCSSTFDIPLDSSVVSEKITEFIMAGWELSLPRAPERESHNEATGQPADQGICNPGKSRVDIDEEGKEGNGSSTAALAETCQEAKPAEGQRGSRPGKGKNRKGDSSNASQ